MDFKEHPEPEWTAENMNRKEGDTTFKICGWCEYGGCGSVRYGCTLNGYCELMSDYDENHKVHWDTPCRIMNMGREDLNDFIRSKKYNISGYKESIERRKKEIAILQRLKVKNKPLLPNHRSADHFLLKSVIYLLHNNRWNRGIVVMGYRSGDGCVSYVLDDYPESKKGWGCGFGVPGVILEWEYKYFKKHPEDFKIWLDLSDKEYNGERINIKEYYDAMVNKKGGK